MREADDACHGADDEQGKHADTQLADREQDELCLLYTSGISFDAVSRDPARARYTYDDLRDDTIAAHRLIVNATPLGTWPATDRAPRIPYAALTPRHYLLDLVYNPPLTRFLALGRERGARILNGERMLYGQAESA